MKTGIPTLEQRFVPPGGTTTSRRKARMGFIGAGAFICAHHLLTAHHSRNMTVGAIAELNADNLRQCAEQFSPSYTTTDYRKLLSDPDIDIVVIGTKDDLHARLIVESLDAGKWVFCEKPMAETREETEAVLTAERRSRGRLAIGFNRRFSPAYIDAKRLMQRTPRPWFINYRLMAPSPEKQAKGSFYAQRERILYEGTHILDLVCWFLDSSPVRVFMSGDRFLNNCSILEFADGSRVSFMCGSMGSHCLWKEYLECFSQYCAITVSEFIDMRVRGLPSEFDRIYPLQRGQLAKEISNYGFDFYETFKVSQYLADPQVREWWRTHGLGLERVRRAVLAERGITDPSPSDPSLLNLLPDKGWESSLEHFACCFLDGKTPGNADGHAGALSTQLALALLESHSSGRSVAISAGSTVS